MEPLDRLIATEEIKALKARYFRTMDTKDWDAFAEVFAPDAVMDVSGEMQAAGDLTDGIVRGRAAIAAFVRGAIADVQTVHHGHTPEIELDGPERATGTWAMEDRLRWSGGPIRALHGYGHYHETYARLGERWLIASTRLTRLRVDVEMNETP